MPDALRAGHFVGFVRGVVGNCEALPRAPLFAIYSVGVLEGSPRTDVTLEPLEDFIVIEPLDETETASGLIVPVNEAAQTRTGIVASVGPEVSGVDPGDKVIYPRDAGYEVRLARSPIRMRVIRREDLIARVHD